MRKNYRLNDLDCDQYEELVGKICIKILGTGTIVYSQGKDGGKDGKFNGTANKFPSASSPINGKIIIQAKHTTNPIASCSDSAFNTILNKEIPKLEKLIENDELEYYLLFTNRKLSGVQESVIRKKLKSIKGIKDAWIIALQQTHTYLDDDKSIWKSMGFDVFTNPLRINPEDIGEVIIGFHDEISGNPSLFNSATNFNYTGMLSKNKINGLTKGYYEYIKSDSMIHFNDIKKFLENPRNTIYRDQYHSTADEFKSKLISKRDSFDTFDDVLTHLYDLIIDGNPHLKHRRRLANVFLHYMYFDCDIGKHA